jgi:hypothetical protein
VRNPPFSHFIYRHWHSSSTTIFNDQSYQTPESRREKQNEENPLEMITSEIHNFIETIALWPWRKKKRVNGKNGLQMNGQFMKLQLV